MTTVTPQPSWVRNMLQGFLIWGTGWLGLAVMETLMILSHAPELRFSTMLVTITAYTLAGAAAGMLVSGLHGILKPQRDAVTADIVCYGGCIIAILLCVGLAVIHHTVFPHARLIAACLSLLLCVVCAAAYLLLHRLATALADREMRRRFFCSLYVSLCVFLLAGIHINENLLPGKFLDLSPQRLVVNCLIFLGCCALFCIVFALLYVFGKMAQFLLLPTAATYYLLLFGMIAWGAFEIVSKTSTDNLLNEIVTLLKQRPSVILISIDTLRADHLSCYGYHRNTTPHIDRLTKEAILFQRAYAPSSWTLPSHASIMTGCYPSMHNAHRSEHTKPPYFCTKLSDDNMTIAELLSDNGYDTAGIVAGTLCKAMFGLGQGFRVYDDDLDPWGGERKAHEINELVFAWLNKREAQLAQQKFLLLHITLPVFLFVHYFDPHQSYMPPAPFDQKYPGRDDALIVTYGGTSAASYEEQEIALLKDVIKRKHALTPKERDHLVALYDGEVSFVDDAVGKLMQKLKELKLYSNSMIIVTADHGESFGEHQLTTHGLALYDDNLRVPLIVKYPVRRNKGAVAYYPVSLVDIFPEILSTVSLPIPRNIQGAGLTVTQGKRYIIAENFQDPTWKRRPDLKHLARDLQAIYAGDFKYIWASDGRCELYNVVDDPHELSNVIDTLPRKAQELHERLELWKNTCTPVAGNNELPEPEQSIAEKLRALGYID